MRVDKKQITSVNFDYESTKRKEKKECLIF